MWKVSPPGIHADSSQLIRMLWRMLNGVSYGCSGECWLCVESQAEKLNFLSGNEALILILALVAGCWPSTPPALPVCGVRGCGFPLSHPVPSHPIPSQGVPLQPRSSVLWLPSVLPVYLPAQGAAQMCGQEVMRLFWSGWAVTGVCAGTEQPGSVTGRCF